MVTRMTSIGNGNGNGIRTIYWEMEQMGINIPNRTLISRSIQGGAKMAVFWYALTSSNINRFSKLFHCQNQEKTCNNTVTKDATTPQVCRYTTL